MIMHLCSFLSDDITLSSPLSLQAFCFDLRRAAHLHSIPLLLCSDTSRPALRLNEAVAPQDIYHPPLSLPLWIRDLPFSLSLSVPHSLSLSPPSFSLTVSPVALRTESSTADAFSPTCPYLQKKARRGTLSLWIWLPHHSACSVWRCVGGVGFLMEWLQHPPPCTICPFWLGHRGNVASLDGWISQLYTLALFWRKLIIISCGRAVRSGVTEAGIRGEKLTPGEFLNELLATSVMEKDNYMLCQI